MWSPGSRKLLIFVLLIFISGFNIFSDNVIDKEEEIENLEDVETAVPPEDPGINSLPDELMDEIRNKSSSLEFQAEVNQMMQIIVNSLYTKKEIFLRELISNANDALDKIRYYSVRNHSVLDTNEDLCIKIRSDPPNKILIIQDSGIGMTKSELVNNLGTIAKSGTKDFVNKMKDLTEQGKLLGGDALSLIGQFGVGFYSTFLVADRVIVVSKHNDELAQQVWESDSASFRVADDPRGDTLGRGTAVILQMRDEAKEFLEENKLIELAKKYSEFIDFPIYIWSKHDASNKEVPLHWRHINTVKPIWMRPTSEIGETEYNDFFNFVYYGKDKEVHSNASLTLHFTAEGEISFHALVFIPDKIPSQYLNAPLSFTYMLKLYSKRVFITDDTKNLLPFYLGYVGGVIDSDSIPLNVGRETLQQNKLMGVIKKKLTRKILDGIKKLKTKEGYNYTKFYEEFGTSLKYGILDDSLNANRIANLLLFKSSHSPKNYTSLEEYVLRMKPGQAAIYYITASTLDEAKRSPYVEKLRRKDIEVLYMTDNIDESAMNSLKHYSNKQLQHVGKVGNEADQSKSEEERLKEKEVEFKPMLDWIKDSSLKNMVASVSLSNRLVTSSCVLIGGEYTYSGNMERLLRSQSYVRGSDDYYESILSQPKNLEINPFHPLVKIMLDEFKKNKNSEKSKEAVEACFASATLSSGYTINDPYKLASFIEGLLLQSHNINPKDVKGMIRKEMGDEDDDDDDEENQKEHDDEEEVIIPNKEEEGEQAPEVNDGQIDDSGDL